MAIVDVVEEFSAFYPHPNMDSIFHHLYIKMSLLNKLLFVLLVLRIIYGLTGKKYNKLWSWMCSSVGEPLPSMCKVLLC